MLSTNLVTNADEVSSVVLDQAIHAAAQGTFAVGGCIVENATGRIVKTMHNNVLKPLTGTTKEPFISDPTAHGELQLVSWYYAHKVSHDLPEPHELTVVTTLDPCVMCTGALITAGFNVAVVAIDAYAGINFDKSFSFRTLPSVLRPNAKSRFGYYACGTSGVDPKGFVREYVGGDNIACKDTSVSIQRLIGCDKIFQSSVDSVRTNSSDSGASLDRLKDPIDLPPASPIRARFKEKCPEAFSYKSKVSRLPDPGLRVLLQKTMESTKDAENAVAFLDPFGNLLLCFADTFDISPIQTAFMNVTQTYARIRFELMDKEISRKDARDYLTHPKHGTFIFLYAPSPSEATTIMTIGAYGSTMEGPVPVAFPSNFQYYMPPHRGTIAELRAAVMNLPPFYTELAKISLMEATE